MPGRRALSLKQKGLMMLRPIWMSDGMDGSSSGGASVEKSTLLRTLECEAIREWVVLIRRATAAPMND